MDSWSDNNGFPMKLVILGAVTAFIIGTLGCVVLWEILRYLTRRLS